MNTWIANIVWILFHIKDMKRSEKSGKNTCGVITIESDVREIEVLGINPILNRKWMMLSEQITG